MVVVGDRIHHVGECELALSEAKAGDWILWPEIGQFDDSLLTRMRSTDCH